MILIWIWNLRKLNYFHFHNYYCPSIIVFIRLAMLQFGICLWINHLNVIVIVNSCYAFFMSCLMFQIILLLFCMGFVVGRLMMIFFYDHLFILSYLYIILLLVVLLVNLNVLSVLLNFSFTLLFYL